MEALTEPPTGTLRELLFTPPAMPDHYQPVEGELHTYAIANGAGSEQIHVNLLVDEPQHRNLFPADVAEELESVSPWLIRLIPEEPFTEWLLEHCFGKRLLLFIQSLHDIDTLAAHLRNYTRIEFPDQQGGFQPGFFSFYDPSIFPVWAGSLNRNEVFKLHDPISNFWYESNPSNQRLSMLYASHGKWRRVTYHLTQPKTEVNG